MNLLPEYPEFLNRPYQRRTFIADASKGLLALGLMNSYFSCSHPVASSVQPASTGSVSNGKVVLPPLEAPTEQSKGPLPDPMPEEQRIGYAIVGLGHLSLEEILPAFGACKKSKVVALVSGNTDKAKVVAKQYGISEKNIYNYDNYDTLKDNPEVQAIYIVLPNAMHAEYTIRGAKAGKHILCEKPMAVSTAECKQMIAACKEANVKLMVAYRIQYEPMNTAIKKRVREEADGKVKMITASNGQNTGDRGQWRLKKALAGGGALPDVGIYCLNTIRFLTGEEPIEVSANSYNTPGDNRFTEVEESVLFRMSFPSGIQATCTTGYSHHISRNYRVLAENAFYGMDPAFSYKGLRMFRSHAEEEKEILEYPSIPEKDQFALEIDHMSDSILNNTIPYTPGEEGLQDQKIMEAMYESAASGKVVKLEVISGKDVFRGKEPKQ